MTLVQSTIQSMRAPTQRASRQNVGGVGWATAPPWTGAVIDGGRAQCLLRFGPVTSVAGKVRSMAAQIHDRISIEPDKMDGQPCIRGLRFPVVSVLRMIAGGMTAEEILDEHPDLEPEDILRP